MKSLKFAAVAVFGMTGIAASASVDNRVMVQPIDAVIIDGGPGNGNIADTYNQNGLSANYVSGVTKVLPYVTTTTHTTIFAGFEWFGNSGTTTATVSYLVPLDGVKWIDSLELWNEESSGIGLFDLWYGATAGELTNKLLEGVTPTDNPLSPDYLADVYHFDPSPAGWYTLVMSDCPQPNPGTFAACAIGEVAFNGAIPEPATWAMMIAGFGLVGFAARRRREIGVHSA